MKRLGYENSPVDGIDALILGALIDNARISLADLARKVGLSPPSVSERVRRLEEIGVIGGYSVKINPAALGYPLSAWLRIRPVPGQFRKVAEILRGLPEVVECDRITGEDCFMARAHIRSVEELEALIDEIIPFATTNTSIIQSSPVPRRLPPIEAGYRRSRQARRRRSPDSPSSGT